MENYPLTPKKQADDKSAISGEVVNGKLDAKPTISIPSYNRNTEAKQVDFIEAYVGNLGLIHKSCELAGVRFGTYRGWIKNDEKFKAKFEEAQQIVNEKVEESLMAKFKTNSPVPEIFYLKSRDKRYAQTVQLEGNEDKPIVVTHDTNTLEKISRMIVEQMKKE